MNIVEMVSFLRLPTFSENLAKITFADMNVTLWSVLEKACVHPVLISERFSMEQTMLVAILHHRVGMEVGESSFFLSSSLLI